MPVCQGPSGASAWEAGEEGCLGVTGREGQVHGSGGFDDARRRFPPDEAQGHDLGLGQIASSGTVLRTVSISQRAQESGGRAEPDSATVERQDARSDQPASCAV